MGEKPRQEDEQPTQEMRGPNVEHLAEGFKPIMACVGTREEYRKDIDKLHSIEEISHNVDYSKDPKRLPEDFKNAGRETYVISPIDGKPKFTEGLYDCTSLVAVGREKGSERELSFLTHQDPKKILVYLKDSFDMDLKSRLDELKEKCQEGSIDIVISGGQFYRGETGNYQETLKTLTSIVQEIFGFEPLVICGPKNDLSDDVYFDTEKRRLYVVRPSYETLHNDVFKPSKINDMKDKWRGTK